MRLALALLLVGGVARAAGLTPTQVRVAMRANIKSHVREIARCYRDVDASARGYTTVVFVISARGKVVSSVGRGRRETDRCLADLVRTFEFPPSQGSIEVSYPFEIDFAGA